MKKYYLYLFLGILMLSSCMRREFLAESDYSYQGNFKHYKTFNFLQADKNDSSMNNEVVKKAIQTRMELQGYKLSDKNPSLLVSYKIFYDDLNYKGYNQQELEEWLKRVRYNRDDEPEADDKYDEIKHNLKNGALLVTLIESKRNKAVWQGYTAGLFSENYVSQEIAFNRAVRSIFDRYRIFAQGFPAQNL
jgi:hypothetical protein